MRNEIWKTIQGYDGLYEVSNRGNIRSLRMRNGNTDKKRETPLILKQHLQKTGYIAVILSDANHHRKCVTIHRIVAKAFLPNPNDYPEVNHKDENRANNNVNNLEWCTRRYNQQYGNWYANVLKTIDKLKKPVCKHDGKKIIATYSSIQEAARKNNVSAGSICNVCKGNRNRNRVGGYYWEYLDEMYGSNSALKRMIRKKTEYQKKKEKKHEKVTD